MQHNRTIDAPPQGASIGPATQRGGLAEGLLRFNSLTDDAVRPHLPADGSYALIGFPDHSNVGDSAIWMGEIACLERLSGAAPRYVADRRDCVWDDLRRAVPGGPVFLSGGGNFGDTWPEEQRFREDALARLPDRQLVQLPQSIAFSDTAALERAASAIAKHGNLVLMVRDEQSFALAQKSFDCPVALVPDMAMSLGAIARRRPPNREVLFVLRNDRERVKRASDALVTIPRGAIVCDWVRNEPGLHQVTRVRSALRTVSLGTSGGDKNAARDRYYKALATQRLNRGRDLLGSAQFVISDRLHVHILCTLLGVPHAMLDQSCGKTSAFIATWTAPLAPVNLCSNMEEAIADWQRRSPGRLPA